MNNRAQSGRRPTDPSTTYPAPATYPPQQNVPASGYRPARDSSLAERDIYDNAGLNVPAAATAAAVGAVVGAAAASRGDYLRPDPGQHGRGDSYGHHSQASSYHSAYSHQPYGSHYQDPSTAASQYNYGASDRPYDQAAAYGQAQYNQHSRSPPLPGQYPPGGHSQYPSHQSTYPPANYTQQQQNAYDPYSDSYNQTPAPGAYPPQQSYTPPHSQSPYPPQHQSSYPVPSQPLVGGNTAPQDLNFPGVVAPTAQHRADPITYASSPEPINTQLPYGAQAAGSSTASSAVIRCSGSYVKSRDSKSIPASDT
ncbi:hypothetical protein FRB90_003975 [Tulasnella sp. 427]|nr:hypothetical protein FRB90_003975 [Tulasnella sp. 427]